MKTFKKISELVHFALTDKTGEDAIVIIRKISEKEAKIIKAVTGQSTEGYVHIIDRAAISHTLKKHGTEKTENPRGQVPVNIADFEKVYEIINGENLIFKGYTDDRRPLFLYEQKIGNTYFYTEEVRLRRKKLCMKTMFKRK